MKPLEDFYITRNYERVADDGYCTECQWVGKGHNQVRAHCKETGHDAVLRANYEITYSREVNKWLTDHEPRFYKNSRQKSDVCIICGRMHEKTGVLLK